MRSKNGVLFTVLSLTILNGCGAAGSGTTNSTDRSTIAPAPTVARHPKTELETLAKALSAVDYSRLSTGPCGTYSMIITTDSAVLYKWANNSWKSTSYPRAEFSDPPIRVTTRDYTWDDVNDFMVNYRANGPEGSEYGGVLRLVNCNWQWASFENADGSSTSVAWLSYDDKSESLNAFDLIPTSMGVAPETYTDIYVKWNPDADSFSMVYSMPDPSDSEFAGGGSQSGSTKTVVRVECTVRDTGMSSSWSGTFYSWTYYNVWSDGSRSVARMGQGYRVPSDC